ncbi:MAG: polymerase, sigma-24 subunit, subfamily [Planctomycetota bacterium]|nr:polymerase, sigma-24 subunit, subfamily [Planctomycetota bacterium]
MTDPHDLPPTAEGRPIDWTAALAEHGRWLRLVVLARVGDRHAVDEVMQEVALAAVSQHAPLRDRAKLGAWLHRLAVRQSLLFRRGQGRRRRLMVRHADLNLAREDVSAESDPLDWLVRDERAALIRTALDRLPRRDAEILLLKYLENWSYREMAAHLGLTPSAIEARLHRARARLRSELSASHVIEVPE